MILFTQTDVDSIMSVLMDVAEWMEKVVPHLNDEEAIKGREIILDIEDLVEEILQT